MKYRVELDGHAHEIEIDGGTVELDGRRVAADLRRTETGHVHLLLEGRSYRFAVRQGSGPGGWEIEIGGRWRRLTALDERRRAIRAVAGQAAARRGPQEVRAPMPGLVVAVQVAQGAEVAAGQGLLVIEAMKMDNELEATVGGRVTDVRVSAGQAVEKGETLVVIEPDADGA